MKYARRQYGVLLALGNRVVQVFIAPLKRPMVPYAAKMANEFAKMDISVEFDLMGRSLKKLLATADSKGARFTIIVGPKDMENGMVSIRDMQTKETELVKLEDAISFVSAKIQ